MTPEGKAKLTQALKEQGEDGLFLALDSIYKVGQIYVEDTSNPLDDLLLKGLEQLRSLIESEIDKVDGIDNA
jgi:hypothetical protein